MLTIKSKDCYCVLILFRFILHHAFICKRRQISQYHVYTRYDIPQSPLPFDIDKPHTGTHISPSRHILSKLPTRPRASDTSKQPPTRLRRPPRLTPHHQSHPSEHRYSEPELRFSDPSSAKSVASNQHPRRQGYCVSVYVGCSITLITSAKHRCQRKHAAKIQHDEFACNGALATWHLIYGYGAI